MDQMEKIKVLLDQRVALYNDPSFIGPDPISIPHQFSLLQDIEISAFWTAMLSWGQRVTIINKAQELMRLMDEAPYDFIMHHQDTDLKRLLDFKHRTFLADDTLYFIDFFRWYYSHHDSLEEAFLHGMNAYDRLRHFHDIFFSRPDLLRRTRKHVSTPIRNSSCKRLNMFLRWMVRRDDRGVDFGIWRRISPSELMIPLDVHVFKVATQLGLLHRNKADWQAVEELTDQLKIFDSDDPVRYDFALFSMGVLEK